jgi:hypothetical protein
MKEQLLFNIILYVIGYLFLTAGFSLSVHLRHIIAFFLGMALWAIGFLFLIVVSIPLNPVTVLAACILVICVVAWLRRRSLVGLAGSLKKELWLFCVYLFLFIMVNIVVFHVNMLHVVGDSFSYIGTGIAVARSGYFPPPGLPNPDILYFVQGRLIFLTALTAGSYFFGVRVHSTIFPLTALYFIPLFIALFYIASESCNQRKWIRLVLGICGAIMIFTLPAYLFHAYYVNNNLFVSVFYTICIFSIFIYAKRRERVWIALSSIALCLTLLQRTEMSLFSLIPISLLISVEDIDRKDYRLFLLILVSVSLPWFVLKLRYLGLGIYYHDWGLIHVLVLLAYGLSYAVVHFPFARRYIAPLAPRILIVGLGVLVIGTLYFFNHGGIQSISRLLEVVAASKGAHDWGVIWLAIGIAVLIGVTFVKKKDLDFWVQALVAFFAMRVIFYALRVFSPSDFGSGSRIILYILPTGVCYVFLLLGETLAELLSPP